MIDNRYLELVDWYEVQRAKGDSVFVIDIEANHKQINDITDQFEKEDLLKVDNFVKTITNAYTNKVSVTQYEIVDRLIDDRGSLILFTRSTYIQLDRD